MFRIRLSYLLFLVFPQIVYAADIPSPESVLGFPVGADYQLAKWESIVEYFHQVDSLSSRVLVEEIGRSTEDNPYILATISSADTMSQLGKYKRIQRVISHPNEMGDLDRDVLMNDAKTVVLVACSLHSNEIAASQMSMELLYELATRNDEEIIRILDNTIILLVPSANPDGIDIIANWYDRSLGTPWEGGRPPWLYQKYCGHDNNRDWFMLSQKETQILTHVLYREWYPCIIYDIHQMGNSGCRFFVPPFFDPINPNVDPLIHESLKLIGGAMATQFAREGKKGIITNAIYDNWWHGGNRTTPYRHNIVGLLTEAASPRLASPIFQQQSELSGHRRGLPQYRPQVNFADPWPGGWWRLRDVVEYEKTACYALSTIAAHYRDMFNRNYLSLGEKAIRLGNEEPPFAYLIPPEQRDFPTAIRMLDILHQGGIEISVAIASFVADEVQYPKGTYIVYAAQPYRNHVRDLLEPQDYPDRKLYPGGPAEPPYDMAGWTLSYQMGVSVIRAIHPFQANVSPLTSVDLPQGKVQGNGKYFISKNTTNNDFILLNRSLKNKIPVSILRNTIKNSLQAGAMIYQPENAVHRHAIDQWATELGIELQSSSSNGTLQQSIPIQKPRLALYQPWTGNMDEGWTRFVLEQFEFDYRTLHNAELRAGNLRKRYDAIVFPDMGTSTILHGLDESTTAPEYVGGIGNEGIACLQDFVADGGKLLCLNGSSSFAIQYFDLPITNVLRGLKSEEFFCPGSVLRINLDRSQPVSFGMDIRSAAFFRHSCAYDIESNRNKTTGISTGKPKVIATYDKTIPLLSGWILGEKHIFDKAALVSVPYGKGEIILYGFRVQHRAQPHATFRLLFNGIIVGNHI